jgi:hypothetical protein
MAEPAAGGAGSVTAAGRGVGGRGRRPLILAAAGLLIVTAAAAWLLARPPADRPATGLSAPPLQAGGIPCRRDTMAHVHDPTRLVVIARCSTVSGLVRHVHYEPRYGNRQLLVAVDPSYRRFLLPENHGLLTVEVIPTDEITVRIPRAGQHASFHGAFVLNKNQRAIELHPVWRIDVAGEETSSAPARGAGPTFSMSVRGPPTVTVGELVAVAVRTELVSHARRRPAPGAHVFLELSSPSGKGLQWAAAATNSLGEATIHLVALQAPGRLTLTLYANDLQLRRQVITRLPLEVRRR